MERFFFFLKKPEEHLNFRKCMLEIRSVKMQAVDRHSDLPLLSIHVHCIFLMVSIKSVLKIPSILAGHVRVLGCAVPCLLCGCHGDQSTTEDQGSNTSHCCNHGYGCVYNNMAG